jgi:phosphohistidine swiveling domain-containing protein
VTGASDLETFRPGEVLVAAATSPDWEPVMKTAAAIVTSHGGRTCHAAIVARELGVPAVVGAEGAVETLATGLPVTISCADGEIGNVYDGELPFEVLRVAMPPIHGADDILAAIKVVSGAVGRGVITPGEGFTLSQMIETFLRAIEASDFEGRLWELEEDYAARGAETEAHRCNWAARF